MMPDAQEKMITTEEGIRIIDEILSETSQQKNTSRVKATIESKLLKKFGEKLISEIMNYIFVRRGSIHGNLRRPARFLFETFFYEIEREDHLFIVQHLLHQEGLSDLEPMFRMSGFDQGTDYKEIYHNYFDDSDQFLYEKLQEIYTHAKTDIPLLIVGETGTSKELMAKVLHQISGRRNHKLIEINCTAIPDNLLESELFGYVKGAFTGATKTKQGIFSKANGGIIFLDEICKMPRHLQAKLLKVIEEQVFYPLGSEEPTHIDVRFLAAAQPKDMKDLLPDLKYRLGFPDCIKMPTLRERLDRAQSWILYHSLETVLKKMRLSGDFSISEDMINILLGLRYEGNYRELENILSSCIKAAMNENRKEILPKDINDTVKEVMLEEGKHDLSVRSVPPFLKVDNIALKDIIDYADNIKSSVIETKMREVRSKGKDIKTALIEEGLSENKYQGYLKKMKAVIKKGVREL